MPACADKTLLTDVLRGQWNFTGYVISDAGAIKFIQTDHEWAPSQAAAAADALHAGADMALGGGCGAQGCISLGAVPEAIEEKLATEADLDVAVRRILNARFRLGLMDEPTAPFPAQSSTAFSPRNPYTNPYLSIPIAVVDSAEHRELALEAARKGVVVLSNPRSVLPLSAAALRESGGLGVVGPNALIKAFGNYNGDNANYTSILDGLHRVAPNAPYARGCAVADTNTTGFAAAVKVATESKVTIAVMGIDQSQEHETGTRKDIALPGVQLSLLAQLAATGTTLVIVLLGGSAMADFEPDTPLPPAVVWAGYGGEEAGAGLADVLTGVVAPSGKLPITFYTSLAQLPPFASYDMAGAMTGAGGTAGIGRTFRYLQEEPLYYFGHGLTYTHFMYADLAVAALPPLPSKEAPGGSNPVGKPGTTGVVTVQQCGTFQASFTV